MVGLSLPDLKALATHGYQGLIEAWVTTVLDALAEEKAKVDPLDHKVARALLPEYLDKLAGLEGEVAELDSAVKAATGADDEDEDDEPAEDALSTAELKYSKSQLAATKKRLKAEKAAFADRLAAASGGLDDTSARRIVLDALEHDLLAEPTTNHPAQTHRDRGFRDLVGQVSDAAFGARRRARGCRYKACRVPQGAWLCLSVRLGQMGRGSGRVLDEFVTWQSGGTPSKENHDTGGMKSLALLPRI